MSDFAESYNIIQDEQVVSRRPTSESLFQPLAGSTNLLLKKGYEIIEWKINGSYKGIVGKDTLDLYWRFKANAQIVACDVFNQKAGTSGTTMADILKATTSGGAFTSIFSTKPQISSSAGDGVWIGTGESGSGMIAPVFTSPILNVNAGDVLRLDMNTVMGGNPKGFQLNLYYLLR